MPKSLIKWTLIVMLIILLLVFAGWFLLFRLNTFTLAIELSGPETMVLEYGESFFDPGVDAVFRGTLFLSQGIHPEQATLTTSGAVDANTLGKYTITYTANFLHYTAEARRTVILQDTQSPIITLTEDAEPTPYPYQEAGFTAADNYDGDLTDKVQRTEDSERITYTVTDSSGNTTTVYRDIPAFDPTLPRILLEGDEVCTITVGAKFVDPGYRAVDNGEEDITAMVTVEGEVNWLTPGTYPITYAVTDTDENTATVIRTVEVTAKPRPEIRMPREKTVYLTFDDGPGPHTKDLLDLLDSYHVKATFFVTATEDSALMSEIVKRGHSIGIHSVTHDYQEIYSSPESFFHDLYAMQQIIYDETGVLTTLMRFPGGSSNTVSRHACQGIMTTLTEAVQDAGFQYFDWNVDSNDAGGAQRSKEVFGNVIEGLQKEPVSLVLQHDIHPYSVAAVEDILQWALENGYTFKPLRETSPGFHHEVQN